MTTVAADADPLGGTLVAPLASPARRLAIKVRTDHHPATRTRRNPRKNALFAASEHAGHQRHKRRRTGRREGTHRTLRPRQGDHRTRRTVPFAVSKRPSRSRGRAAWLRVADNLIKCNAHYGGKFQPWKQQKVDSRDIRCRVASLGLLSLVYTRLARIARFYRQRSLVPVASRDPEPFQKTASGGCAIGAR